MIVYPLITRGPGWNGFEQLSDDFVEKVNLSYRLFYAHFFEEQFEKSGIVTKDTGIIGDGMFTTHVIEEGQFLGVFAGKLCKFPKKATLETFVLRNAITVNPIKLSDGSEHRVYICGEDRVGEPGTVSLFNHSCTKKNAMFIVQEMVVYKNMDSAIEVDKMMRDGITIPDDLLAKAMEVDFVFDIVCVFSSMAIAADTQIFVSYNSHDPGEFLDIVQASNPRSRLKRRVSTNDYFLTRRMAVKQLMKARALEPHTGKSRLRLSRCSCDAPNVCPKRHWFLEMLNIPMVIDLSVEDDDE
jgi:hypothetical protein